MLRAARAGGQGAKNLFPEVLEPECTGSLHLLSGHLRLSDGA